MVIFTLSEDRVFENVKVKIGVGCLHQSKEPAAEISAAHP